MQLQLAVGISPGVKSFKVLDRSFGHAQPIATFEIREKQRDAATVREVAQNTQFFFRRQCRPRALRS